MAWHHQTSHQISGRVITGTMSNWLILVNGYPKRITQLLSRLTHWPLKNVTVILKVQSLSTCYGSSSWEVSTILNWSQVNATKNFLVICQPWFRCHQATSHYLRGQCRPRSMSPYSITKPWWVKIQCLNCVLKKTVVLYFDSNSLNP